MNKQFSLRSKVRFDGVFWEAAKPADKFSGTLISDGKHIELTTSAQLVKPEPSMFPGIEQLPVPDIVHGYTSNGDCTVIGFQEIDAPSLLDFKSGRGVRCRRFRVTGACLTGWHLSSDTDNVLTLADITYSGINQWLPGCGKLTLTQDAKTVSVQTRNYFTHPGIAKKRNVLTGAKEIFLFNQRLHVLLRLLLLKSIGFAEEGVFEQVLQQARRWT